MQPGCDDISENPFYATHSNTLVALGVHVKHFCPVFGKLAVYRIFFDRNSFIQLDPRPGSGCTMYSWRGPWYQQVSLMITSPS